MGEVVPTDTCLSSFPSPYPSSRKSPDVQTVEKGELINGTQASEIQVLASMSPITNEDTTHKEIFKCPQCPFSSVWKSSFQVHLKYQHTSKSNFSFTITY